MKTESLFLIVLGVFFAAIASIYWFISYEDGGGMMLLGSCLLGFLPGFYYFYWHRRFHGHKYFFWGQLDRVAGERPEDHPDASMEDGAGVINSFPGSSIWPFTLGMGAFLLVLSLVFGTWFLPLGVSLMLFALIGVTAESRRGGHV